MQMMKESSAAGAPAGVVWISAGVGSESARSCQWMSKRGLRFSEKSSVALTRRAGNGHGQSSKHQKSRDA